MPAPKSVTKIKTKNGNVSVEYTTDVDAAAYYMHELTRAALRDVGKYVAKVYRTAYYSHFKKRTGGSANFARAARPSNTKCSGRSRRRAHTPRLVTHQSRKRFMRRSKRPGRVNSRNLPC